MIKPDIQNIQSPKETKNALISLQDAAKIYGYTQYHFGLLCRQGKLKSERHGKKWLTSRIWIGEYLGTLKEHYKSANSHYTNGFERISVREEIPVFLFSGKDFCKSPFSAKSDFKEVPKSDFKIKSDFVIAFSFSAIILFVVYFFSIGFLPNESISGAAKNFSARFSTSVVALVSDAGGAVIDFSDFSERTKNNFQSFFSGVKSVVFATRDFVLDPKAKLLGFGRMVRLAFAPPKEVGLPAGSPTSTAEPVEPQIRDGLVVFPSGGTVSKETAIKLVKDSFSDEVIVKPDEDGDAGVIQPAFKNGKGGEYIYVMVPAKKAQKVEEKNNGPGP